MKASSHHVRRRKLATAAGLVLAAWAALVLSACSGSNEAVAPAETAAPRIPATTATTTTPVVEPLSTAERQWVRRMHRIRPRIDRAFQRNLTITRASMQSLVRVLGTCKATLKEAGRPTIRFRDVASLVRQACDRYHASSEQFEQAIAASDLSGAVLAGSAEEAVFNRALGRAFAAQSNGSNTMIRAEERADRQVETIEEESSS